MKLKPDLRYIISFLFLTMLCGLSHEMVHHVTGAAICGCWGYKTFNSFTLCDTCDTNPFRLLATMAGPVFTFGLMWLGWYRLQKSDNRNKQLGFALIFANFPINRIVFAFMGYNDEQWVASKLFGDSSIAYWITILLIIACTLPPLIAAYRQIRNDFRWLYFSAFFFLPFVFIVIFAGFFLEEFLLLKMHFLSKPVLGVPYLLILTEIVCLIGYGFTKRWLYTTGNQIGKEEIPHGISTF